MKYTPDAIDEVHDIENHRDPAPVTITYMQRLDPAISAGFTHAFKQKVQSMHADPANQTPNERGNVRAQTFEEGEVAMAVEPSTSFPPDLYLMDFFDTRTREICSRMHKHTGQRFVMIFTGPDTIVQTSSLSPIVLRDTDQKTTVDTLPLTNETRYTYEVPPNSVVAVQVPTDVSHQFNAVGPNALIISTHIEEMTEVDREKMTRPNMMAQTIFLQDLQPKLEECGIKQDIAKKIQSTLQQFLLKENAQGYISAIQAAKQLKDDGLRTDPYALHGIILDMEREGSTHVKRVPTIGSATTALIQQSALNELKNRYAEQQASRLR